MKQRMAAVLLLLSGSLMAAAVPPAMAATPSAVDRDGAIERALRLLEAEPRIVHGSPGDTYTTQRVILDPDGATHVRFGRSFGGLPVLGGDVVVHHGPDAAARTASVTLDRPITMGTKPSVPASDAAAAARKAFPGKVYDIVAPRLVVDALSGTGELAWEVVVDGTDAEGQGLSRLHVLVDAHRGTVRDTFDEFPTGTGHGIHNGTVYIGTTSVSGGYAMTDPFHGYTATCDMDNGYNYANCQTFMNFINVWGDGTQANRQSAGVDAHYGAGKTYDYYSDVLGRDGIWGNGNGVTLGVHAGNNWFNAQWTGGEARFGDGPGGQDPLVTLDIVGHELSHGLTQETAGLIYNNESGGLNESTSDIFGTMVEFYANNPNDPRDYELGEELSYFQPSSALRYMYDPSLDGVSANCWFNGVGNMDVHYSSGIGNHFFFLLAQGSGQSFYGTSPTCDGSTVVGIGRTKAARIWYRALEAYMLSNETYHDARASTLAAAEDLYGTCGTEYMSVRAAWAAVDVGKHSSLCLNVKKFYFVDSCWPCNPIPDPGPLRSRIVIDQVGNPQIEVGVNIAHARSGDLQIDLIAPSGRTYRLKNSEPRDRGVDLNEVYQVDLGTAAEPGVWVLQITDNVREASGVLQGWTMLM